MAEAQRGVTQAVRDARHAWNRAEATGVRTDVDEALAGAALAWVDARLASEAAVEAGAEVLSIHRWKSMGVSSVMCECGEVCYGPDDLTQFPADEAFRRHLATAALDAVRAVLSEGGSDG